MLNPATIALIISGIQAAIQEAPAVVALVKEAKQFISGLFSAGLIDAATQDALHAHVDQVQAAALSGQEPPEFVVDADPS